MKEVNLSEKYNISILAVLLIAAFLRIGYFLEYYQKSPFYKFPITDSFIYLSWAEDILSSGNWLGDKVFWRAPFYPYFLAVVKAFFPAAKDFVLIFQHTLGLINLLLIYRLSKMVLSKKTAVIAVFLCAFYAPFVYYEGKLLPDTLGIFFILLSTNLLIEGFKNAKPVNFALAGLFIGIGCVARPFYMMYLFLSILGIYLAEKKRGAACIKKLSLYMLVSLSVIGIVTLRNYAVGKDFVLISANGGVTFYNGNNPYARGGYGPGIARFVSASWEEKEATKNAEEITGKPLRPSEVSSFWLKKGVTYLLTNPKKALWLFRRKLILSMNNYELGVSYNLPVEKEFLVLLKILFVPFGLIFSLGMLGMVLGRKKFGALWPMYIFVFSVFLTLWLFHFVSRYRMSSVPFLAIFAGLGLEEFIKLIKQRKKKDILLYSALLIAVLGFSYLPTDSNIETAANRTNLGMAFLANGKPDKAMESFNKAVSANPGYILAYMGLGDIYFAKKKYKDALLAYRKAMETAPAHLRDKVKDMIKKCEALLGL